MKIYKFFIGISLLVGLSSCGDWLDLEPSDTTTETDLFATGDGYRIALNGVYEQMAGANLYGQELNWGFVEVLAQAYSAYDFGYAESYTYAAKYAYKDDRVKTVVENIWSTAYNDVANCNNIIQRIENESIGKFAEGKDEKDIIKGEALALRAYLHFDILRLFAPSMLKDDGKLYIPYVKTYPCTFQEYSSNQDVLKQVIADLQAAKSLLKDYETRNINYMITDNRMENYDGPDDLFFAYRGYRMNYYAVCALLARVYSYAGKYQEAFEETEIVVEAYSDRAQKKCFTMTTAGDLSQGKTKLYDDIIFCLSNQKLWENYEPYYNASNNLVLSSYSINSIFDDEYDTRSKVVKQIGYKLYCTKNVETTGKYAQYSQDMLPMIRLGEMYFIRAEYYNNKGDLDTAIKELENFRTGYNCSKSLTNNIKKEILNEVKREYLCEGQLFFYYKKFNNLPSGMSSDASFVLERPDNEEL